MGSDSICHPTIAEVLSTSWLGFLFVFVVGVLVGVRIGSEVQARIYRFDKSDGGDPRVWNGRTWVRLRPPAGRDRDAG